MAKPRIFVSSTYYDLKHIRNSIQAFIEELGYESVLFEDGDIAFHHDAPMDISCYAEIKNCHILVLIVGGRYGAPASGLESQEEGIEFYNSITRKEYETARKSDIPIYVFIEKNVHSEYHTYKKNRNKKDIEYAHVDNVNIFKLIEDIYAQKRNNLIRDFEKFDDISNWLRDQWAGLFADLLSSKKSDKNLADLSTQVSGLKDLSSVLKRYSETMMEKLNPDNFENIIQASNKELRNRRMERFSEEPMISWLIDKAKKGIGLAKLYEAFESSTDLSDFLTKSKFDSDFIEDLVKNSPAVTDYEYLKKDLLG